MSPQQEGAAWQQDEDSLASKQPPHISMEQLDPYQSAPRLSVLRRESFIMDFAKSKGPPQIVFLCMLLAMGFGSTIGVVRTFGRIRSGGVCIHVINRPTVGIKTSSSHCIVPFVSGSSSDDGPLRSTQSWVFRRTRLR
jgi:hypothetical protein